jgi:hypothetical protein
MAVDRPIFVEVASAARIYTKDSKLCGPVESPESQEGQLYWEHCSSLDSNSPINGKVTSLDIKIGDIAVTFVVPQGQSCSVRFHIADLGAASQ